MNPSKAELALASRRAADQAHINHLSHTKGMKAAEAEARRLAQAEGLPFGHYTSHFDTPEWLPGRAYTTVRARGVVQAEPEDVILLRQAVAGEVEFFSVRLGCLCVASHGVVPLIGWDKAFEHWARQFRGPLNGYAIGTFVGRAIAKIEDLP